MKIHSILLSLLMGFFASVSAQTLVTPPAGLASYDVNFSCLFVSTFCGSHQWQGRMGWDGQDVYIQGMFQNFPEAWVKGSLTDADSQHVVFETMQYLGIMEWTEPNEALTGPFYFVSSDLGPSIVMNWDDTNRTLHTSQTFIENRDNEKVCHLEEYYGITISPSVTDALSLSEQMAHAVATYDLNGLLNTTANGLRIEVLNDGRVRKAIVR